jgi:hypothetical protein
MACSCGVEGVARKKKRCAKVRKRMTKRCTKKAFTQNVRECLCRTDKSRAQCLAIAYSVARKACKKARRKVPR